MSKLENIINLNQNEQQTNVNENLSVPLLIEKILKRKEGQLTDTGAVCATTGNYTGRSPSDRFIVKDDISEELVDWGQVNQPIDEVSFERLLQKVKVHLNQQDELFTFKGFAGADENFRLPIEVINEYAWHNLFARQLFITPTEEQLTELSPAFTILSAPNCFANPVEDNTKTETFIVVSFKKRIILIGGTEYAGEIKKSIFSVMNYILPQQDVLSMHCSANVGDHGDVALFFGLSGTGKTTLSADKHRKLIGDDEHGWSPDGVFNIEGGCYAKCEDLSEEKEPEIYKAIRFGSVLENVILDAASREPLYADTSLTENTRAAYPLENIDNIMSPSMAGHPNAIIFLTADASGTLPPISKLTKEQAMYHFLSGFTSKLAGTERGITKPEATFSTCFGAPFLPLAPNVYAKMLGEKINEHDVNVFLVNTGWTGGQYGTGSRIKLAFTRAMIHSALEGELNVIETTRDEIFGLNIPLHVPGVPEEILVPRNTWDDKVAYDLTAKELAKAFHKNFKNFHDISEDIQQAGPTYK